jgi:UV DNA damage endonuclease
MRIGYPCVNIGIGCTSARTFRLRSWSPERFRSTVRENLACLSHTLGFNIDHGLLFFRITSDLIPFASHPVNGIDWENEFAGIFAEIGDLIRKSGMRISMHPDQFTLINSPDEGVTARSIAELAYHAAVLDAMGLDTTAKIQIHAGGVYGDKTAAMERFLNRYQNLPVTIRRRLVVENDDRLYTAAECCTLNRACGVPVLFDTFHHECHSSGEETPEALALCTWTWKKADGIPMVDYSSQEPGARKGAHARTIDLSHFRAFLAASLPHDIDLMLEIKDKEKSALLAHAAAAAAADPRLAR